MLTSGEKKNGCKLSIPKQNHLYYIMSGRDDRHETCLELCRTYSAI